MPTTAAIDKQMALKRLTHEHCLLYGGQSILLRPSCLILLLEPVDFAENSFSEAIIIFSFSKEPASGHSFVSCSTTRGKL